MHPLQQGLVLRIRCLAGRVTEGQASDFLRCFPQALGKAPVGKRIVRNAIPLLGIGDRCRQAIDDALTEVRGLPDDFLGGRPGAHHDPGGHGDDG